MLNDEKSWLVGRLVCRMFDIDVLGRKKKKKKLMLK